jgi:hypothetical protein
MYDPKFASDLIAFYVFWGAIILGTVFLFGATAGVLFSGG